MSSFTSPTEPRSGRRRSAARVGGRTGRRKNPWVTLAAVVVMFLIWQLGSLAFGSPIILPSPAETAAGLVKLLVSIGFWQAVGATLFRGLAGFLLSCLCGTLIGGLAGYSRTARSFVSPFLTVIRSTPVMSVILLALIWFHTDEVPVFVGFLMGFPIICGNIVEGVQAVDRTLLEMARAYRVPPLRVVTGIHLPSVFPYFIAGVSTALGITWKVVVAAEVLSQPVHAIGTGLALAKYRLDTAEVFAWTVVAILLSGASDALLLLVDRRIPWRNRFDGA